MLKQGDNETRKLIKKREEKKHLRNETLKS